MGRVSSASTYQSEEPPWPCWSLKRVSRDSGGQRDAIHEPGTLQQTVNALLADELKRLLVQLGTEVATGCSAPGQHSCRTVILRASTHRMGGLLMMSSSISSSCIWRSRTARYSHSRNSCSTSCQGRMFSCLRATLTLATGRVSHQLRGYRLRNGRREKTATVTRGDKV